MIGATRYLPARPFPPYTYIPGRTPHPISDPAGHSFGKSTRPSASASDAPDDTALLWGIDLFNHGYYWEAHEAREGLWHEAGRRGPAADFFKGLIQLAVSGVKYYERRDEGMRRHAARAAELLRSLADPVAFGLCTAELIELAESIAANGWPDPPPIVRYDGSPSPFRLADIENAGQQ